MRKKILIVLVLIYSAFFLEAPCFAGQAQKGGQRGGPNIGEAFKGEVLVYEIGFWFFDDVGEGIVELKKEDGEYVAVLTSYTKGMVDKIIQHRKDVYTARLKMTPDGKRFVSRTFEKVVDINGRVRYGRTEIDHKNRIVRWRSWGGGKEEKKGEIKIPEGTYLDDPLAAFYNFRFGAYGPVEEGREYNILTFASGSSIHNLYVKVVKREELTKRFPGYGRAALLADANLGKELFGSGSGWVEILFSKELTPIGALVRDIFFFGDVRGRLRGEGARVKTGGIK